MFSSCVSIFQHHFHRFFKICNFERTWQIAHLRIKILPRRWHLNKNPLTYRGKIIFRRFWISNQIFHSLFRSWDIEQSLDTTIGCFHQKAMFLEIAYMQGFFHTMNRSNEKNQINASKSKFSVESEYLSRIVITSRGFELCIDFPTPLSLFS